MTRSIKGTILLGMTIIGLAFSSCKKDKNTDNGCSADMPHVAGTYKLTALQYQQSASAIPQNYLAFIDDCEKDDLLVLNTDGTYDYQDKGTTCDPSGSMHGKWSIRDGRFISDDPNYPEGI
ncbi:MAG: lipocalin family protein, partial [Bacteroidetes bacterium]|nr:lipocalin family protein [Bacteroidota bacterium]